MQHIKLAQMRPGAKISASLVLCSRLFTATAAARNRRTFFYFIFHVLDILSVKIMFWSETSTFPRTIPAYMRKVKLAVEISFGQENHNRLCSCEITFFMMFSRSVFSSKFQSQHYKHSMIAFLGEKKNLF
jgi:hypothetical protein